MSFPNGPALPVIDMSSAWEFVRTLLIWVWNLFTTDFISYGTLRISVFDVFFGFMVVGILFRLIFSRVHIASAFGTVRARVSQESRATSARRSEQYRAESRAFRDQQRSRWNNSRRGG